MGSQVSGWFPPSLEIRRQELAVHFWEILLSGTGIKKSEAKARNTIYSTYKIL